MVNLKMNPGSHTLKHTERRDRLSVSSLREQLEVARAIGLVGFATDRNSPAALYFSSGCPAEPFYAIASTGDFSQVADLRNHIEAAYWGEAVRNLLPEDHLKLKILMEQAWTN
jgi:hypothetical protein